VEILGIDIGGTGIKAAPVDTQTGELLAPRKRIVTPQPSLPEPVGQVVAQLAEAFEWKGWIGCGFPAVVMHGKVMSAANISKKWIGVDAAALLTKTTGCPTWVLNDADAAGMAEADFGVGRNVAGSVLIITIGTGLGTALFVDGRLVPNLELGHIELDGQDAEAIASDAARRRDDLSWKKWGKRFNRYLAQLEMLLSPELIILGGGGSKDFENYRQYLTTRAEVKPAQLLNNAGIVGAAMAAQLHFAEMGQPEPESRPQPDGPKKEGGHTSKEGRELEEEMKNDPKRPGVEDNTFEVIDPNTELTPG
jgi:polyphosphate glucokinase